VTIKKLNLGCGFDKREGFVNADNFARCNPDVLFDIEQPKWEFRDNQFDYVLMKHVLEHVGREFKTFSQIMRELYRVLEPNGILEVHVPHFRHDSYWSDPTHVRAFTPLTFQMMSKRQNDEWIAKRANYTMLAYVMEVDFETVEALHVYDNSWSDKISRKEITREEVRVLGAQNWGVVRELQIKVRAIKNQVPARE